jgi:hypothetical protein
MASFALAVQAEKPGTAPRAFVACNHWNRTATRGPLVGNVRFMVVAVAHLTIAATWLGSMVYSLLVVQPRVALFFTDESRREEFLLALAHGNRWRVVAVVGALMLSAVVMVPGRGSYSRWSARRSSSR